MTKETTHSAAVGEGASRCGSVYLGLGSNVGNRAGNLADAARRVAGLGLEITRASSVYESEPVGVLGQPWFSNQVLELSIESVLRVFQPERKDHIDHDSEPDSLSAGAGEAASRLLAALLKIEFQMGRKRSIPAGPRVIDIDLLLFGDLVIRRAGGERFPETVVPHPRMHLRRFVLEPLCEISAGALHPALGRTCAELLASLHNSSQVRRVPHHQ